LAGHMIDNARFFLSALRQAIEPLTALCARGEVSLSEIARASVEALENLGRDEDGRLDRLGEDQPAGLYAGDAGEALVAFLRELTGSQTPLVFAPRDWPDMLSALMAGAVVK